MPLPLTDLHRDYFPDVQTAIDACEHPHVMLLRLAAKLNNGTEHFDHSEVGYSWLCLRCAIDGLNGGTGLAGAIRVLELAALAAVAEPPPVMVAADPMMMNSLTADGA